MCTSLTWEEQRGMVWKVLVVIASRSIPGRGSIWSMQQWQPRNRARRSRVGGIRSASCERPASPSWSPRCRQAGHWWSVPRSGHFLLDSIFIAWTIIVKYIIGFFTKKQTETISYVVAKPDPFKKIFRRGLPLYYSTHILLLDFDQIHTYVQVWSIQQYMKSDRHAPAMQALIITQFNAWHFMSLPRSLSKSHPWSTSETPVGSVARSEAAPLPSSWAWPLHTALTNAHNFPSEQSETRRLDFFEKWRARHLTVLSKWECFRVFCALSSSLLTRSPWSHPHLHIIKVANRYWYKEGWFCKGSCQTMLEILPHLHCMAIFSNLSKRCQIKVHNQL